MSIYCFSKWAINGLVVGKWTTRFFHLLVECIPSVGKVWRQFIRVPTTILNCKIKRTINQKPSSLERLKNWAVTQQRPCCKDILWGRILWLRGGDTAATGGTKTGRNQCWVFIFRSCGPQQGILLSLCSGITCGRLRGPDGVLVTECGSAASALLYSALQLRI